MTLQRHNVIALSRCERSADGVATVRCRDRNGASPKTAQRSIGHTRGRMARPSQAPVLVLAAEDALPPPVAMAVRAAAA